MSILFVSVCVCVYKFVCISKVSWRPEEGAGSPRAGIKRGCTPPDVNSRSYGRTGSALNHRAIYPIHKLSPAWPRYGQQSGH